MAMTRGTRELVILVVASLLAFGIAVSVLNVRSNQQIKREVRVEVARSNQGICDILRFSLVPGPRPPQPSTDPTSDFGKQLAEYNRLLAIRQAEGRQRIQTALTKYRC